MPPPPPSSNGKPQSPPRPKPSPSPSPSPALTDVEAIRLARLYFPHTTRHAVVGEEITCVNSLLGQHTVIPRAALLNRIAAGPPPGVTADPDADAEPDAVFVPAGDAAAVVSGDAAAVVSE